MEGGPGRDKQRLDEDQPTSPVQGATWHTFTDIFGIFLGYDMRKFSNTNRTAETTCSCTMMRGSRVPSMDTHICTDTHMAHFTVLAWRRGGGQRIDIHPRWSGGPPHSS